MNYMITNKLCYKQFFNIYGFNNVCYDLVKPIRLFILNMVHKDHNIHKTHS